MPITEDDVKEALLASASENSTLLVKLESTEEGAGKLPVHLHNLSLLQKELEEQHAQLDALKQGVETKLKLRKKYGDWSSRKILYRASFMLPKFEEKAMKGEQEYFASLAALSKAQDRRGLLQSQIHGAEEEEVRLKDVATEHGDTHRKIDELYESLFAGPTPGYLREDGLEQRFYTARGNHEKVKATIISARQALRQLQSALSNVKRSRQLLENATEEASNSFLFFDAAFYSLGESNRQIEIASATISRCSGYLEAHTNRFKTITRTTLRVLSATRVSDGIPSSRNAVLSATKDVLDYCTKGQEHTEDFIALAKRHRDSCLDGLKTTARTLEDARQALHQTRMGIFEEVAGFGRAAPSYTECCDRAASYCEAPEEPSEEEEELDALFTAAYTANEVRSGRDGDTVESPPSPIHHDASGAWRDGRTSPVSAIAEDEATVFPMSSQRTSNVTVDTKIPLYHG